MPKETANLLIMIEVLKIRGNVVIRTDRTETITKLKLNIKKWEKEDFLQKADRET